MSALVLGGALALDVGVAEPPERLHPVAWFGRLAGAVDTAWTRPRLVGVVAALALPAMAGLVVTAVVYAAGLVTPLAGVAVAALSLFISTSLRRLLERGRAVVAATESDLDVARERLQSLAGRDASQLSAGEIRSGVVESLAENLADGLVGPLFYYAIVVVAVSAAGVGPTGTIAAGTGAAAWVKGVNTLDSMLGYRTKPTGWGPARLDDAVMWLPARVSALVLAVALGRPGALRAGRRWQSAVASPNSGWPMATMAAGLDVRLQKPDHYDLNPDADLPDVTAARVAIRRVAIAGVLAYVLAGVVTWS